MAREEYTFLDGVGKISIVLAEMINQEQEIETPDKWPPSAYQFRLGWCKGVLVHSNNPRGQDIYIRS